MGRGLELQTGRGLELQPQLQLLIFFQDQIQNGSEVSPAFPGVSLLVLGVDLGSIELKAPWQTSP